MFDAEMVRIHPDKYKFLCCLFASFIWTRYTL